MWPGTQTTNYWPAGQQQKPSKPESHTTESLKIAYLGGPANSWHFWLYLKTSHYDGQISQISWRFYGLERGVRYICIYVCVCGPTITINVKLFALEPKENPTRIPDLWFVDTKIWFVTRVTIILAPFWPHILVDRKTRTYMYVFILHASHMSYAQ